jgi:hypothetical protein
LPFCKRINFTTDVVLLNENVTDTYHESSDAINFKLSYQANKGLAGKSTCPIPCQTASYEHEFLPINNMDEDSLGGRIIYMAFATPYDLHYHEYLLYNFGSITASVGGAVGLFLGISLISVLSNAVDKVFDKIYPRKGDDYDLKDNSSITKVKPTSVSSSYNNV